jgi:thiol-disulfide isomerase/thioredoxin
MKWQDRPRWQRWTVEGIFLLGIILLIRAWQHQDLATGQAPPLVGVSVTPQPPIVLEQYRGKPVLIHFFAPWCPICRVMHDNIQTTAQHYPVIMVAVQTDNEALTQWLIEHPDDQQRPILSDPEGYWFLAFGGKALPLDVMVNDRGEIAVTEVGYTSTLGLLARLWLIE